jgi:hypothetical protein
MSRRIFYRLLLAFALAFSGSAAQLHSLGHAQADLASAAKGHKAPSPLKHATDQCLVVHALDGTAAEAASFLAPEDTSHRILQVATVRRGESPAAAFHSRAPPQSS